MKKELVIKALEKMGIWSPEVKKKGPFDGMFPEKRVAGSAGEFRILVPSNYKKVEFRINETAPSLEAAKKAGRSVDQPGYLIVDFNNRCIIDGLEWDEDYQDSMGAYSDDFLGKDMSSFIRTKSVSEVRSQKSSASKQLIDQIMSKMGSLEKKLGKEFSKIDSVLEDEIFEVIDSKNTARLNEILKKLDNMEMASLSKQTAASKPSRDALLKELQKKWPKIGAVESEKFFYVYDRPDGVWFKNTETALINGLPLLDESLPNEELSAFLDARGWYAEPYDSGTLLAFEK